MADDKIAIEIVLDDGSIQKGFAKIEQQAKSSAGNIGQSFSLGFGKIASLAAGALAGFSLKKAVDEAVASEKATVKFNLALANVGLYSDQASSRFLGFANTLQEKLGVSNDTITENAQKLVSLGRLSGDSLERATKAALDLSAGLGIDTASAFDLVAKASAGNAGALGRYGLKIDETLGKNQQFASALGLIESRFGGMAKAIADTTFEGAVNKMEQGFGEILKSIGQFITNSPVVRKIIADIGSAFYRLSETIGELGRTGYFDELIKKAVSFGAVIAKLLYPAEIVFNVFKTGFYAIVYALDEVIAKIVSGITWMVETTKPMLATLFGEETVNGWLEGLNTFKESSALVAEEAFKPLSEAADQALNVDFATAVNAAVDKYAAGVNAIKGSSNSLKDHLKTNVQAMTDDQKFWLDQTQAINNGIRQSVSAGVQAIGASFVKGASAFESAKNMILGIIGDMLVNIGMAMITTSTMVEAFRTTLATLFGGPGLVAGLALVALGGALKAMGGGSGGGLVGAATAPAYGGGVAAEPNNISSGLATETIQKATSVTVNVQGDVLDSDQTGLRIVELMNQAFEKQGAVMVTV